MVTVMRPRLKKGMGQKPLPPSSGPSRPGPAPRRASSAVEPEARADAIAEAAALRFRPASARTPSSVHAR
ncbi:MAG: hypothetical protein MZV64_22800 [Ignavibacteriales bacterium]|nr:hypothetical protein [Ignavibacteriales bacterium]